MLSFDEWSSQQTAPQAATGPLSLPDWQYASGDLTSKRRGLLDSNHLGASDFLSSYYGQIANDYLPTLDTFAKENAGKMVDYNPNLFMEPEDFGFATHRADLRGVDITRGSHDLSSSDDYASDIPYYYLDDDGGYRAAGTGEEGKELFTLNTPKYGEGSFLTGPTYTSAGKYHEETPDEAIARLLALGGNAQTGGYNDFMGEAALAGLTSGRDKWGKDLVNDPSLAKYLNDPNWVARDENGNITSIRAELYPYLMREQLGGEFKDINRGSTKEADGLGQLMKAAILGLVTGGFGVGAAGALGMGAAGAGAGLGATAAGLTPAGMATAGGISGGLSAGLTGNNIGKGILLGGLGGGAAGYISPYVSSGLTDMGLNGITNNVLTKGLTGTLTGGLRSAVSGSDFDPFGSFAGGAVQGYMGSSAGKELMGDFGITDPYAQQLLKSLTSGTASSLASGKKPNTQGMLANAGTKTFQQWLNDQSRG